MKDALAVQEHAVAPVSMMGLLQLAVENKGSIDVIERLAKLRTEERDYQARVAFDDALNLCQKQIGRIAPNQQRKDTNSWWADYAQLDRTIRPIYTDAGFSIAFSEVEPLSAGKVRVKAQLSRAGISKDYYSQITPSTTGPKGNAMATATDADAIALARAKRYLVLDIFNISIGIDKEEKRAVPTGELIGEMADETLQEWLDAMNQADDEVTLRKLYEEAYSAARSAGDKNAEGRIIAAKNKRKAVLK